MKPFDYCGFASLNDLRTGLYRKYFSEMEKFQINFLQFENKFRSVNYPWPRDPLHTWSRCWEYPYVYHHIKKRFNDCNKKGLNIIDFGSGVTFFPFFLNSKDYTITCIDNDVIIQNDLKKANQCMFENNFQVDFTLSDGYSIPLKNEEVDLIYCISVLEHISDPAKIISEFYRVLKENGILIITFDVNIRKKSHIISNKSTKMNALLKTYFDNLEWEFPIDNNIITSYNSPYHLSKSYSRNNLIKKFSLILQEVLHYYPTTLACKGLVLKKRIIHEYRDCNNLV